MSTGKQATRRSPRGVAGQAAQIERVEEAQVRLGAAVGEVKKELADGQQKLLVSHTQLSEIVRGHIQTQRQMDKRLESMTAETRGIASGCLPIKRERR